MLLARIMVNSLTSLIKIIKLQRFFLTLITIHLKQSQLQRMALAESVFDLETQPKKQGITKITETIKTIIVE